MRMSITSCPTYCPQNLHNSTQIIHASYIHSPFLLLKLGTNKNKLIFIHTIYFTCMYSQKRLANGLYQLQLKLSPQCRRSHLFFKVVHRFKTRLGNISACLKFEARFFLCASMQTQQAYVQ